MVMKSYLDLPHLTIFSSGDYSFYMTTSLTLSSKSLKIFQYEIDLPKLTTFTTGQTSFYTISSFNLSGILLTKVLLL